MENIMTGNPLLNTQNNFKVKRRWAIIMNVSIMLITLVTNIILMQRTISGSMECTHPVLQL